MHLQDLARWTWLEWSSDRHEAIPGDHGQQQCRRLATECAEEAAECTNGAQSPGLLVGQVVAAEENVSTGDDGKVDAHQEVTGGQVSQVQGVLSVCLGGTRTLKEATEEHEDVSKDPNGGHYPDT